MNICLSPRHLPGLIAVVVSVILAACGSTAAESITGPLPEKCAVALSPAATTMDAGGGTGSIAVTTDPECAWTAEAQASWIAEVSPTRGQGSGQITFRAAQNPSGTPRESAIVVNNQRLTVRQDPAPCGFETSVSNTRFPAAGGAGTVNVSGPSGCAWTAASNVAWIAVPASAAGSGAGTATFAVAPNGGGERTGTLTVAGIGIAITQDAASTTAPPTGPGPSCAVSLQPSSTSIPAAGGTTIVNVTTGTGCSWTAATTATWISFTTSASGSGSGSLTMSIAANAAAARTGVVTIGGAAFTVNQAGSQVSSCTYSISPTSASVGRDGGTGTVSLSAVGSGCAWTAVSNAAWITITSGGTGSGGGTVSYSVAANSGAQRTGTLTIAGQTFTVTQGGAAVTCTFSIDPTSQTIGGSGGPGTPVSVTAPAGCTWTATANVGWLSITSGSNGSGNGTVTFAAASFGGNSRTGTLTIAGQTFAVTQVRCSISLTPETQAVPVLGGQFTASVTAPSGCGWTASDNVSWIAITSGSSGSGNGTVTYLVAPNIGGARTGTIDVDGRKLTVNQAALLGGGDDD